MQALPHSALARALEQVAGLLPAQGPITVFIHHNPLHTLEHLRFDEAVVAAGRRFGCEAFLSEERYREKLGRGRIRTQDLEAALAALPGDGRRCVGGLASRQELRMRWLVHGIPEVGGIALSWLLAETDTLAALREDLPAPERARLIGTHSEPDAVRGLWEAARTLAEAAPEPVAEDRAAVPLRHRDRLLAAGGIDIDERVHPLLIRWCAAYLDQGIASWSLPHRELGFYRCVLRMYGLRWGSPDRWSAAISRALREEQAAARSGLESIACSLESLGVSPADCQAYLEATALALRGWAGMFRQLEVRPDRAPVQAPAASFVDFMAVRLVLERACLEEALGGADLARLPARLRPDAPPHAAPRIEDRAWPLFQLAQLLGCSAAELRALDGVAAWDVFSEIEAFDATTRRKVFQEAFERQLRHRVYDAVGCAARTVPVGRSAGRFQAIFCVDEREESLRRHLEEIAPDCATFGTAGFFGVAMHYRGADETHGRPLCPVAMQPRHEVRERRVDERAAGWRRWVERRWSHVSRDVALGSRALVGSTVGTALLGALTSIPLLLRVLFPRWAARIRHGSRSFVTQRGPTRLALHGFSVAEMADIVRRVLEDIGLDGPDPLVLVVGHGSTSLNNPHESAHDCGACGGGRGGPNARAFAAMANDPRVRARLAETGTPIAEATWFIAAEHNTASDAVDYLDEDLVPQHARGRLREAQSALEQARARNAHERCRRFQAAPSWYGPALALRHVEARSEDLAQTRPEYGHATNAFALVGRRARTRGLFLDRRAFLVSYDPESDDAGATRLARILAAIVPVLSGISLEYWFGYVDPTGYGCGTKLPHNVTGLVGVMDGHASDLRTGLPRQMVEIHEPVRLTLVVEADTSTLERLLRQDAALERLVRQRWLALAALAPRSGAIREWADGTFVPYRRETAALPEAPSSAAWYAGRREFLDFARITVAGGRT